MSDPLRVALVAEGPTDRIVIEAAMASILDGRSYILKQLQPEESLAFGRLGTGWGGVYHWCRQASQRAGGALGNDPLFGVYDMLLLHLDASVADEHYANANIEAEVQDLPCSRPCPPPADTTNELRRVLLRWGGEAQVPPRTVLCTPSKDTETWVLAALFPHDRFVNHGHLECSQNPTSRLAQQPVGRRIKKCVKDYQSRFADLKQAWPRLSVSLSEARRFNDEFKALLPAQAVT